MQSPYEMPTLRMKLNTGDPVEPNKAIYTLVKHIEVLEERLAELERKLGVKDVVTEH